MGGEQLDIEFDVNESIHNSILWYKVQYPGQGREAGQTITKEKIIHCRTTPNAIQPYLYQSEDLTKYVQQKLDPTTSKAVLYSVAGFAARMKIKKELEAKIERRSLWCCCLTCGLILCRFCCCCPGRKYEKDVGKLNEDYYCSQMKELYPAETTKGLSDIKLHVSMK